ncbi:MAG: ATP-binding protein [candidate division Zixibacteria bacterium]|nr:ATP-binding protein [candidate division Zixibacteria bacterium]
MSRSSRNSSQKSESLKIKRKNNQIIIPSSLDYLPKVDEYVEGKLRKLGVDKDKLIDIAISVTEAVTNAVVHGNKNDLKKKVRLKLKADSSRLEITVEDEGDGFDPGSILSPLDERNVLKEVGRGIFILKSLMDKVDFIVGPQKGTIVKMTKFLS